MTMKFRTVKAAIIDILGKAEKGRFRTIGYQDQALAGDAVLNGSRSVQVYVASGSFPKAGGAITGPVGFEPVYRIEMTAGSGARGDIETLESPTATDEQRETALANFQMAASRCDSQLDELIDIVYQELMDARNYDLGQAGGEVANRWIQSFEKGSPIKHGEYVIIQATMDINCRLTEYLTGDTGTSAVAPAVDQENEVNIIDSESADLALSGVQGGS